VTSQKLDDLLGYLPGHDFRAVRAGIDVAVRAGLVTELAHVDLQHLDPIDRVQGRQVVTGQHFVEIRRSGLLQHFELTLGRGQRVPHLDQAGQSHIPSFLATLRICTPCTSDAPPRMALDTCTASVIWSRSAPFCKHDWV